MQKSEPRAEQPEQTIGFNRLFSTAWVHLSARIGDGTSIWQNAHVRQDVEIGANCNIGGNAEIGAGTIVGNRVRIGFGTFIPNGTIIGDDVFIGPNVTACDDKDPVANNPNYHAQPPIIEDFASIGAGAVILPGVIVGKNSLVGAGAVVTRNVPPNVIVAGNPARIIRKRS